MIKLSKESKYVFSCLMVVPIIWVILNHFGHLDYLKTKSVDLRLQFRGEIPQNLEQNLENQVQVEGNLSLPRVPKVCYVNFDGATLSRDDVGERPWDRAFFRDTSLALLEKGNARVLAFDFGFTPKSMSSMVPKQNSFRSDAAMGELVLKYSDRVVLGCLFSGVPTSYVKPLGASAFAPYFKDGFSLDSEKTYYPESPTYPLINYLEGKYLGRTGSFTVPPYRAVDEIPRWVPLWFPSKGKAHAYNILGGKRSKLEFELPLENSEEIRSLQEQLEEFSRQKNDLDGKLSLAVGDLGKLREKQAGLVEILNLEKSNFDALKSIEEVVNNFRQTLNANPVLEAVITPQMESKILERDKLLVKYLGNSEEDGLGLELTTEKASQKLDEIEEILSNLETTLEVNPALEGIIRPQIDARRKERSSILSILDKNSSLQELPLSNEKVRIAEQNLRDRIQLREKKVEAATPVLTNALKRVEALQGEMTDLTSWTESLSLKLGRLKGASPTEIIESNQTLKLVYARAEGEEGARILVDSLPNEVPLMTERTVFTLGLEALLAYYGLDADAVKLSPDNSQLKVLSREEEVLIACDMSEKQFVEVNWFSKWTETLPEKRLLLQAKRAYGEGNLKAYLQPIPSILSVFLNRVDGVEVAVEVKAILRAMEELGVEEDKVLVARKLLNANVADGGIPSYSQLEQVVMAIKYYSIPPTLESPSNPMCGMHDILQYAEFHDQVSATIKAIENQITSLAQDKMNQINQALSAKPKDENLMLLKSRVMDAIATNQANLKVQREEMARIRSFFKTFENSIVLIGPEEATFQDLAPTPFDKASVPKVSVHGNLIKTLTNGKYLTRLSEQTDYALTFLVCIILAFIFVYQGNGASLLQGGGLLLLGGYVAAGFLTFSNTHVVWPITAPACAGLSTSFIGLAAMLVIEQKAKGRLKGMFGSYVSSDLVEQMVESGKEPSLGGEETPITAFFSDVQAFSSFSELLTPTGLVDLMNEYLTEMTNILQAERGTLDKYIGDAIVAMYGAPIPMEDHAYQSVRTAILMQQKQIELREKWVPEEKKWGKCHGLVTQMQTRIGCNTGTATVGNMGALDRFNYTMMGDMVNLAARCESGAKAYGAYIMITEETKVASEQTRDDIAFRYLDKIVVKGRSQPVAMYEPTGFMRELTQETQDCLDCFRQGIEKYLIQDWDGALNMFEKAKALEPNKPGETPGVKDNPSMILIDRCKIMKENPPGDDWDGVYVMTSK